MSTWYRGSRDAISPPLGLASARRPVYTFVQIVGNVTRALRVIVPFALHGLAREVDEGCGVLLHTTLDLPGFVPQALALVPWTAALGRVAAWAALGALVWVALAGSRVRRHGTTWADALAAEAHGFSPLLLRPTLTVLALVSLAVQPTYPYGFTLP